VPPPLDPLSGNRRPWPAGAPDGVSARSPGQAQGQGQGQSHRWCRQPCSARRTDVSVPHRAAQRVPGSLEPANRWRATVTDGVFGPAAAAGEGGDPGPA
jgi:hypothetical protein